MSAKHCGLCFGSGATAAGNEAFEHLPSLDASSCRTLKRHGGIPSRLPLSFDPALIIWLARMIGSVLFIPLAHLRVQMIEISAWLHRESLEPVPPSGNLMVLVPVRYGDRGHSGASLFSESPLYSSSS